MRTSPCLDDDIARLLTSVRESKASECTNERVQGELRTSEVGIFTASHIEITDILDKRRCPAKVDSCMPDANLDYQARLDGKAATLDQADALYIRAVSW